MDLEIPHLVAAIQASIGPDTTDDWHPATPFRHQCGVAALVVQDHLGGEIVRNKINGHTTWFNRLPDGTYVFAAWPEMAAMPRVHPVDLTVSRAAVMRHRQMPARYPVLARRTVAALNPR